MQRRKHGAAGRPARMAWPMQYEPLMRAEAYNGPKLLTGPANMASGRLIPALWGSRGRMATGVSVGPKPSIAPTGVQVSHMKRGKPVLSPLWKADRKEGRWECGQRTAPEANAAL